VLSASVGFLPGGDVVVISLRFWVEFILSMLVFEGLEREGGRAV